MVGSMTDGLVWEQVYGMLRQLALPESRAFTAYTGDDTTIYGMAFYVSDGIGHLYNRPPPHPRTSCSPWTGCLSRWLVHRGMRRHTSIARLVGPRAPTNYLVRGY